ncbi:MAG: transposase [Planctomycetota bacterium]
MGDRKGRSYGEKRAHSRIVDFLRVRQTWLFPMMEDELGVLDDRRHREFIAICEVGAPREYVAAYRFCGNGCPPKDRLALCKAFIAKAVWDFPTTRILINAIRHNPLLHRLCGWETLGDIPSETTFSRGFAAFAQDELPTDVRTPWPCRHHRSQPPSRREEEIRTGPSHALSPLAAVPSGSIPTCTITMADGMSGCGAR